MTDKPRILVVDDDAMTRLLVQEVLSDKHFEVIVADTGQQGLELVATAQPDLVLLDVMMPEMDGFEFLRQLGAGTVSNSVPVVMMTAVDDIDCVEHAFAQGASDFISKPIQWLLLPYRIRYVLRQWRAEETLRIANEEQQAILNSATSGIVLINNELILRCNRKLEDIFAYAPGELDGQSIQLWYPDEAAYQEGRKELAEGKFHRREQQFKRKDGSLFWGRFSGQVLDHQHAGTGIVGIIDDITLENEAAKALLKAKELAEEATKMKSDFLANMSHEIRTPMNGVLGMLDLLRETAMTPLQQDWVETAHNSADALMDILNDILDFSKLEAGKFDVTQSDFNLVELIDDVCALLATRAHTKGLELNCAVPAPMPLRWHGDAMRIRQVLTNLIGNAVKFTEQGEVSVNVTRRPLNDLQDEFHFAVQDTGIGISEASQARLFQPFSQAESTISRHFGGSGLGLSISKKLVELMGGTIGLTSSLGQGSCFWFTLPLSPSTQTDIEEPSYDLSGKRVLVVDDNATNRNIVQHYLKRWGLAVGEAASGSAALVALQTAAIQGMPYELVILDVQMPTMDGLAVANHLANMPGLATIPIILLSSGDQLALADYQHTGIVQRLLKPVRYTQLFEAIAYVLQGVQAQAKTNTAETLLPRYSGKKVLVVEDNRINQKVIVAKLAKFDLAPELAENGQMALDKIAHQAYDLIFMDCQMPIMDGYIATRELRVLEQRLGYGHQTVIALTATAMEGEREKCLEAGMDDYLSKPIVTEQLLDLLAYYLGAAATVTTAPTSTTPPVPTPTAQVWDKTAALKHLEGDTDLLAELISLFLAEAPEQLRDLAQYQADSNLKALANTAHALKGTTALFYAAAANTAARTLELAARNDEPADLPALTQHLTTQVNALLAQLAVA